MILERSFFFAFWGLAAWLVPTGGLWAQSGLAVQPASDTLGAPAQVWQDQAVQVVPFDQPDFLPIRGNREIMLATWFARMGELGIKTGPVAEERLYGDPRMSQAYRFTFYDTIDLAHTVGIAVQREVLWYPERGLLASHIQAFGPGTMHTLLNGVSPSMLKGPPRPVTAQTAQRGPVRSSWTARVRLPFVRTETPQPNDPFRALLNLPSALDVLYAHDPKPRYWRLEQRTVADSLDAHRLPESGWARLGMHELQPEHLKGTVHLTEDWFFDPASFALSSRVVAIDWIDPDSAFQYRLRFLD